MIPNELVGSARVPGTATELLCYRHDGAFTFRVNGTELMNSRVHGSEEDLAELVLRRVCLRQAHRVLVGGLGMGFTLARVLALIDAEGVVEVAELVPEVVDWNRDLLGQCAGHPLRDPRVRVLVGDVAETMRAAKAAYDAILLDVDNGPAGLSSPANDRLYSDRGLRTAHDALRPRGVLGIWSAGDYTGFAARLRHVGFAVDEHHVRARRTKGPRRTIWVAGRS